VSKINNITFLSLAIMLNVVIFMEGKAFRIAILLLALAAAFSLGASAEEEQVLKIFHAGSLAAPMEDLEEIFEAEHPGVDVQREASGSNDAIRKITELGKCAEILNSADYKLIPNMMYPDYANWYITYASNEIVLAYTNDSKYANEITSDNWYDILRRPDVRFFFSNPNQDPCGYRSPMITQLAEVYYNDDQIFEDLIEANSAISSIQENGGWMITVPPTENLDVNLDRLSIRPKSVEAIALLDSADIDYAFEYKSVAVQNGLNYVDLPEEIDLGSPDEAEGYAAVEETLADSQVLTAEPIVYGFTIPTCTESPELAAEFAAMMLSEVGQGVFQDNGQPPIVPARADNPEEVPDLLKSYLE
jgi:molybdate/tungstate transport system substrate-binding protein